MRILVLLLLCFTLAAAERVSVEKTVGVWKVQMISGQYDRDTKKGVVVKTNYTVSISKQTPRIKDSAAGSRVLVDGENSDLNELIAAIVVELTKYEKPEQVAKVSALIRKTFTD